ncbi:copper amine oxidase N-terminal domain-containing protein [Paenibacillus senegalensis]|uniref:copper amine oxidase N-terminal domain-containing protein n=1 Tax=Paenibacillus senegalensis TaxID=1465766 RepID=UPI00028937F0|nr:copper amine oxidase N-terminal domain-containing protein [Paenibacillus senegalensis]
MHTQKRITYPWALPALLLLAAFLLLVPAKAHGQASAIETIYAGFNQITVKVDNQLVESDNLLYEGTTYIPIRNVAEMLGWDVTYYHELKTAYIGMLGAGVVPEEVLERPENQPSGPAPAGKLKKGFAQIPVVFDSIAIEMHAMPVEASNILYDGTTYVPIRAVAELLDMDVNFYAPTSTAYIGKVNQGEVPFETYKEWYPDAKPLMYAEPATGEMEGWQLLKGHEFEDQFNVYFQVDGGITRIKIEDIRPIDLDRIVHWTDSNGQPRQNTVRQLHSLFGTFSEYTSDWLYATFGDVYTDWLATSIFRGEKLVDEYLRQTN